jgi:hypothetical protein
MSSIEVGDFVMSTFGYPHMGNAGGRGVMICKVTKRTPTGKLRLKELPSRIENKVQLDRDITKWDKVVTSRVPFEEKGLLASATGECKHHTFEKIPNSRLDEPFNEQYDSYN